MKIEIETKFNVGDTVYLIVDFTSLEDKSEMPVFKAVLDEIQVKGIDIKKSGEIKPEIAYWVSVCDDNLYEERCNFDRPLRRFERELFASAEEALHAAKEKLETILSTREKTSELIMSSLDKVLVSQSRLIEKGEPTNDH